MIEACTEVGFYGKLPFRGDFLHRRVPGDFVDAWDAWLQQCLDESRRELGDAWLDAYLTGPVWRFVLAEGVCGSGAYAGVLVPSVDRVGRYFPLAIVVQFDAGYCPLDVACHAARWFDAAESLALEALEAADLDVDAFDTRVAQLRDHFATDHAAELSELGRLFAESAFPAHHAPWHVPLGDARSLQRAVNVLAYRELSRAAQPLALWWSDGSTALAPAWLLTQGLPPPHAFATMLAGNWSASGWRSIAPNATQTAGMSSAATGSSPLAARNVSDPSGGALLNQEAPAPGTGEGSRLIDLLGSVAESGPGSDRT